MPVLSTLKSFFFSEYIKTASLYKVRAGFVLQQIRERGGRFTHVPGGEGTMAQLTEGRELICGSKIFRL